MVFFITNKNPELSCPMLFRSDLNVVAYDDKNSGATQAAVELQDIGDIITLQSICAVGNEWFNSLTIKGNNITINEGGKYDSVG